MRTQIALDAEQHALVKHKAADLGISMAEYIRRLVERDLQQAGPRADVSDIFGIGDSGGSDIAVNRKHATAEAITARATGPGGRVTEDDVIAASRLEPVWASRWVPRSAGVAMAARGECNLLGRRR
ncbi:MAG: ribbon-helix-helix protein, CopG family [Acidimicrobiia bacterium]|nr:ribbon-helix-helix domain-containing protein [bacterium]MXZ30192.1 ribbon-helix-helix protein, CopG family [Acidimicrobiia bacterium]MYB24238.1 ribbon-helix-helix protein, CopG family [Acidimicrobiia bacterium]MYE67234.1 ribbon-helix-helix protein, CopG family [Acidimicrobiia bacterium]MYJ14574.1 ribbon-helix-helix protein, CopG family [Acidimicrobiia bacterium]